jgi:hypothetical protein
MQGTTHELKSLPDEELLRRLAELLGQSRRVEADLVAHIGEVDSRRLYLRSASPSMFTYATEVLHLSEAEAYLRIAAARASREHPMLLAMLADGRLHLTAIAKLAPHLTRDNRDAVLPRAAHKSKREVEELVAELAPRPDVPATIRRLPVPSGQRPNAARRIGSAEATTSSELRLDRVPVNETDRLASPASLSRGLPPNGPATGAAHQHGVASAGSELRPDAGVTSPAAGQGRSAVVATLAPGRYRIQFTASAALRDKLERLRGLMRTAVPNGDLALMIEQAVTEKLERLESRRFGRTRTPRKALSQTDTSPRTRQIPAAVKRAVYERDEGRCGHVDEQGRRCTARERLEFHHHHPFGYGGDHSVPNVSLRCRLHNAYLAEVDYGRSAMALRRGSRKGAAAGTPPPSP